MKIIYEQDLTEIVFNAVISGECFDFEGDVFIKLPTDEYTSGIKNAMSMSSGEFVYFDDNEKVFAVDAELHVKYRN